MLSYATPVIHKVNRRHRARHTTNSVVFQFDTAAAELLLKVTHARTTYVCVMPITFSSWGESLFQNSHTPLRPSSSLSTVLPRQLRSTKTQHTRCHSTQGFPTRAPSVRGVNVNTVSPPKQATAHAFTVAQVTFSCIVFRKCGTGCGKHKMLPTTHSPRNAYKYNTSARRETYSSAGRHAAAPSRNSTKNHAERRTRAPARDVFRHSDSLV